VTLKSDRATYFYSILSISNYGALAITLRQDMGKRFEQMQQETAKRFEQVDRRFEQLTSRLDHFMIWSFATTVSVGGWSWHQ
jgi:hypothetical protein